MRARSGFTLLELMVVLVLLALTAGAAVPALVPSLGRTPEKRAAAEVAAAMERARDVARLTGSRSELTLAPAVSRYWIVSARSTESGTIADTGFIDPQGRMRLTCAFEAAGFRRHAS
jgi:type II secretion system protein H